MRFLFLAAMVFMAFDAAAADEEVVTRITVFRTVKQWDGLCPPCVKAGKKCRTFLVEDSEEDRMRCRRVPSYSNRIMDRDHAYWDAHGKRHKAQDPDAPHRTVTREYGCLLEEKIVVHPNGGSYRVNMELFDYRFVEKVYEDEVILKWEEIRRSYQ